MCRTAALWLVVFVGLNVRDIHAARLLGIARQTLRQKLRDLGLHVAQSVEADEDNQT